MNIVQYTTKPSESGLRTDDLVRIYEKTDPKIYGRIVESCYIFFDQLMQKK